MNYSKKGAARDNKGKLPVHLVPLEAIEALAEVLHKSSIPGGGKYPVNNWQKGAEHSVPVDSLIRHAFKRANGEMYDAESKMPHSYHMLVNAAFLVYYEKHHPDLNDLTIASSPTPTEAEQVVVPTAPVPPQKISGELLSKALFAMMASGALSGKAPASENIPSNVADTNGK